MLCGAGLRGVTQWTRHRQHSPPTGTVSPRPRSRGPQASRQGDLPEAAGAGGQLWAQDAEAAVGVRA